MNELHTPGEIAELFGVDPQTLRNWCREFLKELSVHANPGTGNHRRFDSHDLSIIALIAQMRKDGLTYEDIHASLSNGQRGEVPSRLELAISRNPTEIITRMESKMIDLQTRLADLLDEHEALIKERDDLRVDRALLARREIELKAAQEEIARLNREIGRLEGKGQG